MRVLWTARRSNQSILKEISPEHSLEGLMLKLKFQYFGHPKEEPAQWKKKTNTHTQKQKNLMLGKIEGWRRKG